MEDNESKWIAICFIIVFLLIGTLFFKFIDYKKYEWDKIQEIVKTEENVTVKIR